MWRQFSPEDISTTPMGENALHGLLELIKAYSQRPLEICYSLDPSRLVYCTFSG